MQLKSTIKELWKEFTQNEISEVIWVNRLCIFQECSNISLKTVQRILNKSWIKFENLEKELPNYIRKEIYKIRYKYHISEVERYHYLLNTKK